MLKNKTKPVDRKIQLFYRSLPLYLLLAAFILAVSLIKFKSEADCGCKNSSDQGGTFETNERQAYFLDQIVTAPLAELPSNGLQVLGDSSGSNKWIEVDLSDQKLTAWDNGNVYLETLVSTGKFNRTPTGEFQIWSKFKYTKMSGGSKEKRTYYYLPNVPYTMFFYKDYGLHGTYWHNNFGTPMSHGCVNLPTPMAEKLFYWAEPGLPSGKNSWTAQNNDYGTRVVIHQ